MNYPTREGIAVPIFELDLPETRYSWDRYTNNHHNEWTAKRMGQLVVTQCLRDLARHQFVMPTDVHSWLHTAYDPPEMPCEEQAAKEVIDAYENGEQFKRYSHQDSTYHYHDIPSDVVDGFIRHYHLRRVYPMAAD